MSRHLYRWLVAVVGLAVVVAGLVLVPLPGPGWLIVFVGLTLLASEFAWAQHVLDRGRGWLRAWVGWVSRQGLWLRALLALAGTLSLVLVVYLLALSRLLPSWLLDHVPNLRL